ncbi:hypothetical protein BHM03_00041137 [Ensete ventricosum]|nr:hypothetical protein BHM03_00041137 [Ensete ventricosum]
MRRYCHVLWSHFDVDLVVETVEVDLPSEIKQGSGHHSDGTKIKARTWYTSRIRDTGDEGPRRGLLLPRRATGAPLLESLEAEEEQDKVGVGERYERQRRGVVERSVGRVRCTGDEEHQADDAEPVDVAATGQLWCRWWSAFRLVLRHRRLHRAIRTRITRWTVGVHILPEAK